ncbi:MAG: GTP 3',8-cyclase MoaA [Chloroflexi bacterium]|nr:GTP 3',8-cyclase MoaA [Chloroflexota bacterium]
MPCLDSFNRSISYLRVSVTDRCNLRCVYCMSAEGVPWRPHDEVLRYEEIETVVRAAAELGIGKVRLTGGEPLVRLGMVDLVAMLARIPGLDDLAMTTNGILLARYAEELRAAGLRRVNVSLDTLRSERFRRITRLGELSDTLEGIAAAKQAGLVPVKVNTVVIRGLNDDEVVDFARLTYAPPPASAPHSPQLWGVRGARGGGGEWHVRFIEVMPLGNNADWAGNGYVPMSEVRERIEEELGELIPARLGDGSGPARYYRLPGAQGTIGFITPISEHFCYQCNRLRLTADGKLRPCLLSDYEIDLRTPLRRGATIEDIKHLIAEAVHAKPERHHLSEQVIPRGRAMSEIGG